MKEGLSLPSSCLSLTHEGRRRLRLARSPLYSLLPTPLSSYLLHTLLPLSWPSDMIPDNSEDAGRRYCQIRLDAATASGPPHFDYQPLPPRHIRIIELQPGERSDPFRARFIVGSLDEPFEYDALSYMWGDAAPVDRMIVDGAVIPIAWNLARALEYLRDHMNPEPLRIWIDAICIDQQDDVERADQVGLMRLLYRKAECVRIWINAPDLDEGSRALAALRTFQVREEELEYGLGDDPGFWNPILPILQNKYWSRVWM
jgi:hypothetical protein